LDSLNDVLEEVDFDFKDIKSIMKRFLTESKDLSDQEKENKQELGYSFLYPMVVADIL